MYGLMHYLTIIRAVSILEDEINRIMIFQMREIFGYNEKIQSELECI